MNAKQYLKQAFFLNQRINDSLKELERLRETAYSIAGVDTSKDKIQVGSVSDIVGSSIPAIVDLDYYINARIDKYVDKKQEIESQIEMMSDDVLKSILLKRYIHFHEWEQIAIDLGYTYRHVTRLHGEALRTFKEIYEKHVLECPIETVV